MKKHLLIILALLTGIAVTAQQRNLSAVRQVVPKTITSGLDNDRMQQSNQPVPDYEMLYNRSGDLLKIDVSSSSNLNAIWSTDQRVVSARPEAAMAVFGTRAGGSFGATGNDLRIAYSTDHGSTFTNFVVSPPAGSNFRFPSVVVYNPEGNTDPDNMFVIYTGPFTDASDWKGQYFGSARLGGTEVNTTFVNNQPTVYLNHLNNGLTATRAGHVHVASQRLNGTEASYTYAGWEVLNGMFNQVTNEVDWELPLVQVQPELLEDGRIDATRMVFSPDGSIGYLLGTAVDADPEYNPYGVEWPVVYKTTDHGLTWEKTEPFNFSEIGTFFEYLWPTRADFDVVIPRFYNKWASPDNQSNNGATVDINGNLHIAGLVRATNSIHPDSLNYFYTEEPLLIFDLFMNGDGTWNAQFVDSLRSDGLENYLTVGMDQRISMSRTQDGSKVFVVWADTDPTLWGGGVTTNTQPDLFIWGYDVNTHLYTNPVNVTALGDYWGENYWLHVGDLVLTEGTDYFIPVSTSVNGVTEDDPVAHKYFKGPGFNEADFVNISNGDKPSPLSLQVSQNFPNPFSGSSVVAVSLGKAASLGLEVYDLAGQKVYEFPASQAVPGNHTLVISAGMLKPGIYTYTVFAGSERVTRKMVVL